MKKKKWFIFPLFYYLLTIATIIVWFSIANALSLDKENSLFLFVTMLVISLPFSKIFLSLREQLSEEKRLLKEILLLPVFCIMLCPLIAALNIFVPFL